MKLLFNIFKTKGINSYLIISACFLLNAQAFPQSNTNLDIFYTMADSSVNNFISNIPQSSENVGVVLNLGDSYSIFSNRIINTLTTSGRKFTDEKNGDVNVNYVIDEISVEYGEIFRDGLFGDYMVPRNLQLRGNYLLNGRLSLFREFTYSFTDTIKYDEIDLVENESFEFTKGKVPAEPFFTSLLEPVVAVGTAALAVILFFTIRSR